MYTAHFLCAFSYILTPLATGLPDGPPITALLPTSDSMLFLLTEMTLTQRPCCWGSAYLLLYATCNDWSPS